jgi:hypothetical protein
VPGLEREIDRLFGLPLDEFTAARNDLARRLKAERETEAAEQVRTLSKPSVPAWALNQLSRHDPGAVRALLTAGDAVRKAQRSLLERGGPADSLRGAIAEQRDAIRTLADRARDLLDAAGRSATPAMIDRIRRMLEAAAVEEEGRRLLKAGRLTGELEPAGFEAFAGLQVAAPTRQPLDRAAERREQRKKARAELRQLEQRARDLEEEARTAEREAARAARAAADARRAADSARAAADEAAAELAKPE